MSERPTKYHRDIYNPQTAHPDEAHSVLMRLIPPNSHVLELGCSSGYLSGYMRDELGCYVTGLEFDAAAVEMAKANTNEVYQADLDAPDALQPAADSAPYDVVLAAAVLEHLKYPDRILQSVKPMLAPNARVIVSLPNIAYWQFRLRLLMGRFDYEDYGVMDKTHTHLYTKKTGHELMERNGYTVTDFQIAGSMVQNISNSLARRFNRPLPDPILAGLFAYELIYVGTLN